MEDHVYLINNLYSKRESSPSRITHSPIFQIDRMIKIWHDCPSWSVNQSIKKLLFTIIIHLTVFECREFWDWFYLNDMKNLHLYWGASFLINKTIRILTIVYNVKNVSLHKLSNTFMTFKLAVNIKDNQFQQSSMLPSSDLIKYKRWLIAELDYLL